jgi:predicted DNA-binding transcriptional regulator AlpA
VTTQTGMSNTADESHAQGEARLLVKKQGLAQMLSMSIRSIDRKDALGLIPRAIDLSGSKRWRRDEIEGWIAAGCPPRKQWEAMQPSGARRFAIGC